MTTYIIHWLDWDYNHHYTTYYKPKTFIHKWNDKKQIRARSRGDCRKILERIKCTSVGEMLKSVRK